MDAPMETNDEKWRRGFLALAAYPFPLERSFYWRVAKGQAFVSRELALRIVDLLKDHAMSSPLKAASTFPPSFIPSMRVAAQAGYYEKFLVAMDAFLAFYGPQRPPKVTSGGNDGE